MIKIETEIMLQKMLLSRHFFTTFQNLKFRGIEVARYLFYDFLQHLSSYNLDELLDAMPEIPQNVGKADVFSLVDGEYPYTIKPGKKIFIHPWEFLKGVIPLLPADRLIVSVGQKVSNPAAVEQLVREAEAGLKECTGDFLFENPKFQEWFLKSLSLMVTETDQLADLFDQEEIGCVVARFAFHWPFYWPCRSLIWLARSRGIPSIAYQPGVLIACNERSEKWWPLADVPITATFKTVWGPQYKVFFMSFGVPENRLPEIGNPNFDRIHSYQASNNAIFREKHQIPAGHKIILHPTEAPDYRRLATVKAAIEAVREMPETTLLIKTRDREYPEEKTIYNPMIQDHPRIKLVSWDQPIDDLIANADAVVVFFSTTGVEAMLFGKPVVVLDVTHEEPPYSYVEYLDTPVAHDGTELRIELQKIFNDAEYNQTICSRVAKRLPYLCNPDGTALHRLAELIMNVADGKYRIQ